MTDEIARGVNFVYAKEYVLERYGDAFWERVCRRMDDRHTAMWERKLVPVGTYSFDAFKAMARAVSQEAGEQNGRVLAQMYEAIADKSLNALYKIFFRMANPAYVIGNYPKLWSRFFTAGTVTVPEKGKGAATVVFHLPETFLEWIGPACDGYSTKAVTMAGGTDIAVHERSRVLAADGEWDVTFDLRWKES